MKNVILKLNENTYEAKKLEYWQRVIESFKNVWIFYVLLFTGILLMTSFLNATYLLFFFIVLNLIEHRAWNKNYIINIKSKEGNIEIKYLIKNEIKVIKDKKVHFSFIKKRVWYKIKGEVLYLTISHNNSILLKQYTIKDIDEKVLDTIIENFS